MKGSNDSERSTGLSQRALNEPLSLDRIQKEETYNGAVSEFRGRVPEPMLTDVPPRK